MTNNRIQVFNGGGQVLSLFGNYNPKASASTKSSDFNNPKGIAIGPSGEVWIGHPGCHTADKLVAAAGSSPTGGKAGGKGTRRK
jgi:secreted PhoX family phosphatase